MTIIKSHLQNRNHFPELLNQEARGGVGVEVGVCRGDFAVHLLQWNCSEIHLVDAWDLSLYEEGNIDRNRLPDMEESYQFTLDRFNPYDHVDIHRATSERASQLFSDEYFDFIYIDANHSYEAVSKDIEQWWPKIKPGGIFAGHDVLVFDHIPVMNAVWNKFAATHDIHIVRDHYETPEFYIPCSWFVYK